MLELKPSTFLGRWYGFAYIENRRGGNRAYLDDWDTNCAVSLQL